jgi:predicted GNAT superfamily acetyltransferase
MSKVHDIELSIFKEVPDSMALNILYSLNQDNTPEVGDLESLNNLCELIHMSALNFYVLENNTIIGFVICFRENSEYKSPNYNYFQNKEDKFLYIDRVVIKDSYRRLGAGSYLYDHLYELAKKEGIPLCCEVNIMPRNSISLNFHSKKGFKEDGECHFEDHSVRYLKK